MLGWFKEMDGVTTVQSYDEGESNKTHPSVTATHWTDCLTAKFIID